MGLKEGIAQVRELQPDTKLFDLDHPEETVIHIDVHSDTRMAGMNMLSHLTAQALSNMGYQNVIVATAQDHPSMLHAAQESGGILDPRPEEREALKRVKVVVSDATLVEEHQRPQQVMPGGEGFPVQVEDINFDNPCSLMGLEFKRVEIPFLALHRLLQFYYTGGGQPDNLKERLEEVMHGVQ